MWLIILGSVFAFLLYLYAIKVNKYWEEKGVTYIKPLPLLGNVAANVFNQKSISEMLQDNYNAYPSKRYIGFYQFTSPMLLLCDPELIKKVAVKEFETFPEHRQFVSDDVDPLWSKNLFGIKDVEKWHDMRSTLSPAFTSSKMRMMFDLMKVCSKQFTNYFQEHDENEIDMKDAFTRFTNDVIATTAFGVNCDSLKNRDNEFYLMGKDASNFTGMRRFKFILSSISPSLMKILNIGMFSKPVEKFFRGLIKDTIKVREEKNIIRPDMIHLLMEARKGGIASENLKVVDSGFAVVQEADSIKVAKKKKVEITDEDITAQALIFFLAGFDTASTMMCFTAHELAVNPDIQEELQEEVDATFEKCNGDLTYEALLGMKYLDMVISESLRKWPPGLATERSSVKSFTIEPELPGEKAVTIEKGTNVWFPIYPIHRDPNYYPNPEKFDPERFNDANKHNIKPYTYLPFGAGPRNCIGSRFALLEGKLVIAEILSKFDIVPVAKTQIPLILSKSSFNPLPENGFWLGLSPRSKNDNVIWF